ncbi:MAG: hypothetical protein K0B01_13420 [Syntrophobacterales bacterium]|nr:hypothetical protein [Syntrophobacterales bacterium]
MKVITHELKADSRYIVFSDCHRGDGSAGDEFARNSMVYKFALEHYLRLGFTLIELGDAEELWENSDFAQIYITHTSVYDLLAKFHNADPARRQRPAGNRQEGSPRGNLLQHRSLCPSAQHHRNRDHRGNQCGRRNPPAFCACEVGHPARLPRQPRPRRRPHHPRKIGTEPYVFNNCLQ